MSHTSVDVYAINNTSKHAAVASRFPSVHICHTALCALSEIIHESITVTILQRFLDLEEDLGSPIVLNTRRKMETHGDMERHHMHSTAQHSAHRASHDKHMTRVHTSL